MEESLPQNPPSEMAPAKFPLALVVLLCLIFLVTGLLLGKYLFSSPPTIPPLISTPTPAIQPTPAWQTYTNTALGLSFSYPPRLSIYKPSPGQGYQPSNQVIFTGSGKGDQFHLNYTPFSRNVDELFDSHIKDKLKDVPNYGTNLTYMRQTNILGQPAKFYRNNEYNDITMVYWTHSGTGFIFFFRLANSYEMDQILSTFKFTDSNNAVSVFTTQYMDAIVNKNWATVKDSLTAETKNQFDLSIFSSYDIARYEILSQKQSNDKQNYLVTVRMFDSTGNIRKNPSGDPTLLIVKEGETWKTPTWYFFQ